MYLPTILVEPFSSADKRRSTAYTKINNYRINLQSPDIKNRHCLYNGKLIVTIGFCGIIKRPDSKKLASCSSRFRSGKTAQVKRRQYDLMSGCKHKSGPHIVSCNIIQHNLASGAHHNRPPNTSPPCLFSQLSIYYGPLPNCQPIPAQCSTSV